MMEIYASIIVGIALGLLFIISAKLEELKTINREILKQLREEKDE